MSDTPLRLDHRAFACDVPGCSSYSSKRKGYGLPRGWLRLRALVGVPVEGNKPKSREHAYLCPACKKLSRIVLHERGLKIVGGHHAWEVLRAPRCGHKPRLVFRGPESAARRRFSDELARAKLGYVDLRDPGGESKLLRFGANERVEDALKETRS